MVVLSTHFSQMSQDIEEGKYVINVHSLGMGEIVQALLRCSVGVSRSVKVKVVYGAEKVKTPPNLVFELDLDLLTMAVHQVNKIFSPVKTISDIMSLEMRCLNEPRPDLVFLDQNIQTKDGRTIFGTEFSRQIREKGYEGFIVIMSANVSADDVALYFDKGDVDCVIGKHMLLDRKKNLVITSFYESKRMAAAKKGEEEEVGDEEDNELYDKG